MSKRLSAVGNDKPDLSRPRSQRPYRETGDVAEGVCRIVVAIGKRVAVEDPEDLVHLVELDRALYVAWATAVAGLRESGYSDGDIGRVLGTTKQAVQQRWPRRGN